MCGIVGYVGARQAVPIILGGLKRLEYRGYDSAGVAALDGGRISRLRAEGKIANLEAALKDSPLKGACALGHTRWATHGKPSEENAHPHADCGKSLVVVHNGIIENYLSLKDELLAAGHIFESETDTETAAHLIEEKLKTLRGPGGALPPHLTEPLLFEAVRQALARVRGAYALAVIWDKAPGVIIAAKTSSPLILGIGQNENFLASDVPAFLEHTKKAVFLEDEEMAVVKPGGCTYFNLAGKRIDKQPVNIPWDRRTAEKGGFRHFMLKEINEQPESCEDTLRGRLLPLKGEALESDCGIKNSDISGARKIHIVACGTAYHAGLIAKYWLEEMARMPAAVEPASEFRYRRTLISPGDLVVAISQSGETADTLAAAKMARDAGAKILCVCNTVGSALTRVSNFNLYTHCGPEFGVASTKAFLGQLSALAAFSLHCAIARGAMDESSGRAFIDDLVKLPGLVRQALKLGDQVLDVAKKYFQKEHFLFMGRHLNYPIALEAALKLKEISYIHAEGYAAGELKHGPIALLDEGMPVVAISTRSRVQDKMLSNLEEAKARGARIIALVSEGDPRPKSAAETIVVPAAPELLAPAVNIVPLQLLAYHIADLRGCDVDQPRNLAKSVTVE
ncbi:MAG: glutamine--fructose-6-phosphate transaminase (isomerizing) [Elusimicrobiota bacterium]